MWLVKLDVPTCILRGIMSFAVLYKEDANRLELERLWLSSSPAWSDLG